jgi:hypothetical protein
VTSPVVISGFAALDAALVAQFAYAVRDYQRKARHETRRGSRPSGDEHGGAEERR